MAASSGFVPEVVAMLNSEGEGVEEAGEVLLEVLEAVLSLAQCCGAAAEVFAFLIGHAGDATPGDGDHL